MKFSYNLLQEYFKQKPRTRTSSVRGRLPKPEKLADILTMRSFEVLSALKSGKDYILDIDVLPNRMSDCSGHEGLVREIGAILNSKIKIQNSKLQVKNQKLKSKYLEVKVEDKNLCPRYTAAVMRNVKVGPTPKKIKEHLETLGINSINNVVDAANYIMLLTGQPLHIFDFDKIEDAPDLMRGASVLNKQIIVRAAKKGESLTTLDNKRYDLDENILVIADLKEPLALAGIKGGKKAEVDFNTRNIVLESANFNSTGIRKTSQKLNLRTDASIRFSYNLDPNLCDRASFELMNLIKSFCGGEVNRFIDIYQKKIISVPIKFDFNKTRKILGINIKDKDIKNILQKLGFIVKSSGRTNIVYPPTVRRDINTEEDLIEEVGRIYGYEKIKLVLPHSELISVSQNKKYYIERLVKDFFVGQGFSEFYNYSFISENDLKELKEAEIMELRELQNPLSPDTKFLRPALIFNILKNISLNLKNYDVIKIFELGKIFPALKSPAKNNPLRQSFPPILGEADSEASPFNLENNSLAAAITDKNANGRELFFKLKGAIFSLFESLGIDGVKFKNPISDSKAKDEFLPLRFCHPYRYAEIKIKENLIGVIGEVKSNILTSYDIKKGRVVFFEIDFNAFLKFVKEEKEFKQFSKFPKLERDLSLFAPYDTGIEEVENIIENESGKLLVNCEIFDIYEPSIQEKNEKFKDRKSLTFRLTFQSEERTLLDKEVDEIMEKIMKALEENLEWEVRK